MVLGLKNADGIQWLEDFQNQLQDVAYNSRSERSSGENPGLKHGIHQFNLNSIKKSCGEVCHTNITGIPSEPFDTIQKNIQCGALFENPILDAASQYDEPPQGNIDWVHTTFSPFDSSILQPLCSIWHYRSWSFMFD